MVMDKRKNCMKDKMYKIHALSICEFGQRKDEEGNPHQEDCIYPALGKVDDDDDRLFILCDGMGGHAAGEVASEAVCEAMSRTIRSALDRGETFSGQLLGKAITAAYDLLDERDVSDDPLKKMGTTMTALVLHEGGYTVAHIGDSRVYHIRPRKGTREDIVFKTEDHSLVNDLLRIGQLTPEEARTFPRKNVITRAMQPHKERRDKADVHTSHDVLPGDYFYMCSDGMLEQMSDDNLCYTINDNISDEEKVARLIHLTRDNHDNHSAHLVHVLDTGMPKGVETNADATAVTSMVGKGDDVVTPEFGGDGKTMEANVGKKRKRLPLWVVTLAMALVIALAACGACHLFKGKKAAPPARPKYDPSRTSVGNQLGTS